MSLPLDMYHDSNIRPPTFPDRPAPYRKLRRAPSLPNYPERFGDTASYLITGMFNSETNLPLLSAFIERLVSAVQLPFQVLFASLILLQRLYSRLPPQPFEDRSDMPPHQLFAAAYIVAAQQYTHIKTIVGDMQAGSTRNAPNLEPSYLSFSYVFPHQAAKIRVLRTTAGLPVFRELPSQPFLRDALSLKSLADGTPPLLSRLNLDEQFRYFESLGEMWTGNTTGPEVYGRGYDAPKEKLLGVFRWVEGGHRYSFPR